VPIILLSFHFCNFRELIVQHGAPLLACSLQSKNKIINVKITEVGVSVSTYNRRIRFSFLLQVNRLILAKLSEISIAFRGQ
jgi:hypothetical protein